LGKGRWAFPKVSGIAGKGSGEQSLTRGLYRRLEEYRLLIADRNFYNWTDWCTAVDSGSACRRSPLSNALLRWYPDWWVWRSDSTPGWAD
jgi:hypothetical protein